MVQCGAQPVPNRANCLIIPGPYQGAPVLEQFEMGGLLHLIAAVAVVTLAVHLPVLKCGAEFFDDGQYVFQNPLVKDVRLTSAMRFFKEVLKPSTVQGYYQPLTMISLMLDYGLTGQTGSLYAFHRTALMFHVANTLLLSVFLYLLFRNPWAAAISGLLFGIHPVTADTVAWISERKTLLASFFALWSLICYVLHVQRDQRRFYACSVIMYVLALLCKPTAVMLPILMMLLDIWPLRRFPGVRRTSFSKAPFFAICVFSALVTYVSQSRSASVRLPGEFGLWHVPLILCHNSIFYLEKIFWPASLSPFYPYPEPFALLHPKVLPAVIGTIILLMLLVVSLRWSRAAAISFLMFFMAILPTMQIIGFSDEVAANRFLYLPSLGLFIFLASSCSWLFHGIEARRKSLSLWALALVFLTIGVAEALCLRSYLGCWRDTQTLSEHILTISPYEPKVHDTLGGALLGQRNVSGAIRHFKLATKFAGDPVRGAKANMNLGRTLVQVGKTRLGLCSLREVAYACPKLHTASLYLAWILATHPDPNFVAPEEAISLADRAAQQATGDAAVVVLDTLAAAYAANGQFDQAVETGKKALDSCITNNMGPLAENIRKHIGCYRNRQRYWEDPTVAAWVKATQSLSGSRSSAHGDSARSSDHVLRSIRPTDP